MANYDVYIGGQKQTMDLKPDMTLAAMRSQLNLRFDQYQFVYYNEMTEQKMVLNSQGQEGKLTVGKFAIDNNSLLIAKVSDRDPDFFGSRTKEFRDRNMAVRLRLNKADNDAHEGAFEPLMLMDVQPANPDTSDFFGDYVVICEKGSAVQFEIGSWGAAGFGYSIETQRDKIAHALFVCQDEPRFGTVNWTTLRRYQGKQGAVGNTIKIEGLQSNGISKDLKVEYSKITVKTWSVTEYKKTAGGAPLTSDAQPPSARAMLEGGDDDFFGGPPAGDTYVPADSVEPGMPTSGKPSSQKIGTIYDVKPNAAASGHVLGAVTFLVFVFKDKDEANKILNVINSKDPVPFP
jgi:hypothetical protein